MGRSAGVAQAFDFAGTWSGVSSAGTCCAACARRASRLSTASTWWPKTWPNWRAAWWAMASRPGSSMDRAGFGAEFFFKTGDGAVGDAAGIDEGEVAQVGGDVEGEAVRGDAARDVNADGADLAACAGSARAVTDRATVGKARPDAGERRDASGAHAINAAEANEGLFDHAHKVDRTEAPAIGVVQAAQIEDGVADELAGAVIGVRPCGIENFGDVEHGDEVAGDGQEALASRDRVSHGAEVEVGYVADVDCAEVNAEGRRGWLRPSCAGR